MIDLPAQKKRKDAEAQRPPTRPDTGCKMQGPPAATAAGSTGSDGDRDSIRDSPSQRTLRDRMEQPPRHVALAICSRSGHRSLPPYPVAGEM